MSSSIKPLDAVRRIASDIDLSGFDCGNLDFNDFIRHDALRDNANGYSVTYIGQIGGRPAVFVTLVAGSYRTRDFAARDDDGYKYRHIPAIKIARIATDRAFQRSGCGTALLKYSVAVGLKVKALVGCKLIVTDALAERISWYRKFGFRMSGGAVPAIAGRQNYPMYAVLPQS